MCMGGGAYAAQKKAYKRQVKQREVEWAGARNLWDTKLARYDIEKDENVLAYSRQIGAIQRNFGLERDKFLKDNESAFAQVAAMAAARSVKGDRALGYGRNQEVVAGRAKGLRYSNLQRKDVQQTEFMQQSGRQLLSMQNKALTRRGLAPIPGLAPVKPVGPTPFSQILQTASTVAGVASGVQSIGSAAGLGGGTGFWGKFFS